MLARQMLAASPSRRRLPFVTTLHGTDITLVGADRSYLPITRFSIEQSDGVTSISKYLQERTVKEFDIQRPIEVIPNFVNCDIYLRRKDVKTERAKLIPEGEKALVHLSNFRPVKRIPDVIEIFDRVNKKLPARLLMMGDGPDRPAAERLARKKGISDRVIFMGKVDDVHEKLGIADLMLLPSELESFGLAALEGMACEVPSIATNVGGLPEVIDDGKTGFLAPVGDVDTMASLAIDILSDEKRLHEMSKLARYEAQARFCTTKIIPQYEDFYRKVLERSS
jgi:N-acetyl-alpha-D-glucosaminyl L-malate synthase BshA